MDRIPTKLRCANCDQLAVDALELPCCDSNICCSCSLNLSEACPICQHSPISAADCRPNRILRTTVSAYLKSRAKSAATKTMTTMPNRKLPLDPTTEPFKMPQARNVDEAARQLRLTPVWLPQIPSSTTTHDTDRDLIALAGTAFFSVDHIAAGLAEGCSAEALKQYLGHYNRQTIEANINHPVKARHPVVFYAAEKGDAVAVRLLLEHKADPNARDDFGVPTLAYAVIRSKATVLNIIDVVKTLLAFGANPESIPSDMWKSYLDPPASTPSAADKARTHEQALWCTIFHRKLLAETLNLSVRYYLYKASQLSTVKARGMQLANAHGYTALLEVPYLIIGQTFATKFVVDHVSSHIGMGIKSPLVLTFAGLSGHGKTELANQMGGMLGLPMTVIDCAQMRSDVGLFGSRQGYVGNALGSQLNNHLAEFDGQRSVVFLDEFDKTDKEVRNSLLLLLDSGEYHDRRTNKFVDASRTIWIMATNLGDHAISAFYEEHMKSADDSGKAKAPVKVLTTQLRGMFKDHFGAPMAGRMKNVTPFYPFDLNEQAVVVHKFLMELADSVRQPIDLSPTVKRYPGHIHLAITNDGKLCRHLAEEGYITELGARSLKTVIDDVRRDLYTTFVDTEELVEEKMNDGLLARYKVQLVPLGKDISEVMVERDGLTDYYRGQDAMDLVSQEGLVDGVAEMMTGFKDEEL